ncbi:MAG TPA: hypothetical protein VLE89_08195 [Chlamydiales bacterium]|nr:hypothetical protein [Chlamydiales bacterium]
MTTPPPDKSPDSISPGKSIEPTDKPRTPPAPTGFQSYMQETPTSAKGVPAPGTAGGPTPIELARGTAFQTAGPSFNSLIAQARTAQDSLGTVGQQLNTQNLKLKRSQTHLLKNKLSDAHGYIQDAGSKLGMDTSSLKMPPGSTPLDRFVAYVNDGQEKLLAVQQKLKELSGKGEELRPGDMMYLQVKMGLAQQEIEYTSTLLSKVISSITTIMNTQL